MRRHLSVGLMLSWLLVQPHYPDMNQPAIVRIWRAVSYRNIWIATEAFETKTECVAAARAFRQQAQHHLQQGGQELWATFMLSAQVQSRCVPADAVPILPFNVTVHEYFDVR